MHQPDRQRPVRRGGLQHATLALLLGLAACATPREQITDKLVASGFQPAMARCIADRMVGNLSNDQLRRVADAARPGRYGKLTLGEFTQRIERLDDPQIVRVLAGAGVNCVVLG